MLKRRFLPLGLMALGGLLLVGSLVYWRYAEAVANPDEVALPQSLAGKALSSQVTGVGAVDEIARLHGKAFPLVSGAEATYGGGAITVWVSGAPAAPMAAEMVRVMTDKIAEGRSPFTPEGSRTVGTAEVYVLSGMGQQHFYFQVGALVVWLAADQRVAETALQETLTFYQGLGGGVR